MSLPGMHERKKYDHRNNQAEKIFKSTAKISTKKKEKLQHKNKKTSITKKNHDIFGSKKQTTASYLSGYFD